MKSTIVTLWTAWQKTFEQKKEKLRTKYFDYRKSHTGERNNRKKIEKTEEGNIKGNKRKEIDTTLQVLYAFLS